MDYTEEIKKVLNYLFNKKIYFSNESEEIKDFLNEYKELKSEKELINYLETDNCNLILGNFVTKKIKSLLSLNKDDKTIMHMNGLLEDLSIKDLPEKLTKEKIIENNKPFNYFNYIVIDKKFIPKDDDFNEIRHSIKPIEHFIYYISQNDLIVKDLKLIFNHVSQVDKSYQNSKGSIFNNYITVNMYQIKNSILYHEYFHALDMKLNKKNNGNCLSDENEIYLKEYEKYIKNIDKNILTPEETKKDIKIYFKKHFSSKFNKKEEINENDLIEEIKNFRVFSMNCDNKKVIELANELMEHIQYSKKKTNQPKRNLFSIFLEMAGVTMHDKYFNSNSEKLARIYQSAFSSGEEFFYHHDPIIDQKLYLIIPEGTEAIKLFDNLTKVIKNEFKMSLKDKKNNNLKVN